MRAIRRTPAIDALIVLLSVASVAELWLARRADATIVTTVLTLGASATLLIRRPAVLSSPNPLSAASPGVPGASLPASPGAALTSVVIACAAQVALLEPMPRPMISSAAALAVTAIIAGTGADRRAASAWRWLTGALGGAAVLLVAADYAFRARTSGSAAAFPIAGAALTLCWALGLLGVRRRPAPVARPAEVPPAEGNAVRPPDAPPAQANAVRPPDAPPAQANPAEAELASRRLAVAHDLAGTVTAGLSAVIVETVAAQQGLVRAAHPEDILVRVRAAEEHARTASDDLRRLLSVAALVSPDSGGAPSSAGSAVEGPPHAVGARE